MYKLPTLKYRRPRNAVRIDHAIQLEHRSTIGSAVRGMIVTTNEDSVFEYLDALCLQLTTADNKLRSTDLNVLPLKSNFLWYQISKQNVYNILF